MLMTPLRLTFSYETVTDDRIGRNLKIVPSFHGKSWEGFQILNFDSRRSNSQQNLEFQDVLYLKFPRPRLGKKTPTSLS